MASYPHVEKANKYARDVVSGDIPACKWVVLACQRHLDDLRAAKNDAKFPYIYSPTSAEKPCKFIEALPHTKGKWAGRRELLVLEPWQCFLVCCVFGWLRKSSNKRRFRRAELFVPRKNGKSAMAAAIGLYMMAADGEYGAEIYSGATSEKQAQEVFTPAYYMAKRTPDFLEYFGVEVSGTHKNPTAIYKMADGSKFSPVIAKPGDGASPHCAIVDEYHEHQSDSMVETMETGMGAREQPLLLIITTAGDNLGGPCYLMQKDAEKMLDGLISDDQTFALIYTIDKGDDWTSIDTVKKANPNYDVSVGAEYFELRTADAMANSRKQASFRTKHLNQWVGAREVYFNIQRWQECEDLNLNIEQLHGAKAYIGMDLASKVDIAALDIVLPQGDGQYVRFGKYYLPEARILEKDNTHYQGWHTDGWITQTDGEMIDFNIIKRDILALCDFFDVEELAYDPHQATMLVTELMDEGVPVVEMRPTVLNFSEPMKQLDALIRSRQVRHNGDPVFSWMLSNVVAKEDAKENVYPRKERAASKIDGVVANLMALGRCMTKEDQDIGPAIENFISVKL